ncbi:spore coat protein U domain-containing protein [uncultured Pluralibacter sp.]|uniref:Csu type fimbrial protein n=1 Tax=uncultured Pluralibacter sp. TaxID=1490864 RepID=UPI00262B5CB5|nr:spore coat protein U domain-containing protein [uncultured Pluralibacter sp.]
MKIITLFTASALLLAFATGARADSSTGTVGVTLTLTNGCLINNNETGSGINFGTLDFGTQAATFGVLTRQTNSFTVKCNTTNYTVKVTGSQNTSKPATTAGITGTAARYLVNTTDTTQGVAYSLFDSSAMSKEIENGTALQPVSSADSTDTYALWGRIQGNSTLVAAGTYTDTVQISVDY